MAEDTQSDAIPVSHPLLSAEALLEWSQNVDSVMRGVAHALNNRAAALSAVIELARDSTDEDTEATASILNSELQRVSDLARSVRTLSSARTGTEAFAPRDVIGDAIALTRLHADQRERVVSIDAASAPPIRVPRWMFVRALVALTTAAGREGAGAHIQVAVIAQDDSVVVRVDAVHAPLNERSPYTSEMARAMGGDVLADGDGFGFRIPSLTAVRQREAR